MLPKKESTSPRRTVWRPTARISERTSSGVSRGPARKGRPSAERLLLAGEEEALLQDVEEVLHVARVEYAGVVDVRLLERHGPRRDDPHAFGDGPFPVRKQGGDRGRGVARELLPPDDRDVVEERPRFGVQGDDRPRFRVRPAEEELREGEGRRRRDDPEARQARQDVGGQARKIGGAFGEHHVVLGGDADAPGDDRAVPFQLPRVFRDQGSHGCRSRKPVSGKEPSSRSPRIR
jgi:hypothetical protein